MRRSCLNFLFRHNESRDSGGQEMAGDDGHCVGAVYLSCTAFRASVSVMRLLTITRGLCPEGYQYIWDGLRWLTHEAILLGVGRL